MKKLLVLIAVLLITIIPASVYGTTKTYDISQKKKITIDEGNKCTLTVPAKYKSVKWSSNDKKVVTINKSGTLTAVNGGTATITAKSGKKIFKCYVTVKEDYSEWVHYSTDHYGALLDDLIDGNVVVIDGEFYMSPEYFNSIISAREKAMEEHKVPERKSILTPDAEFIIKDEKEDESTSSTEAMELIKKMNKYGFATSEDLETEIGKAYMTFCDEWVSERELKSTYNTSVVKSLSDDKLYLISNIDSRYIITGALQKPESGTIYTNGEVQYQYLDKFEYDNKSFDQMQYFFNRADLTKVGFIK